MLRIILQIFEELCDYSPHHDFEQRCEENPGEPRHLENRLRLDQASLSAACANRPAILGARDEPWLPFGGLVTEAH